MVTTKKISVEYEYKFDNEEREIFEKAYDVLYKFFIDFPCARPVKFIKPRFDADNGDYSEQVVEESTIANAVETLRLILDYDKIRVASNETS